MSCFPESTYVFYVDHELGAEEARMVDTHLVQCRACRVLVVALQEEASLLGEVLHERARPSFRRAPRQAPPPREIAVGVVPMVALGVVALGVLGWILESGLPRGIGGINPFRSQGVYEMAFDLLFLVRDEIPGLIEFAAATAAMASVALLLAFGISLLSRRITGSLAIALPFLAVLVAPPPSSALELHFHEQEVEVAAGETRQETMVVNATVVRIDGVVEGDLIVLLAERLIVRGEVRGNIFSSARSVEMSGKVHGNFHAIGETVRLDGEVERNMYSLSEFLTLAAEARVGRDSTHGAGGASIDGAVARDLFVIGDWVEVRGSVGRNAEARVDRVSLLDGSRVGGDVDAVFWDENEVDVASGAVVGGEVRSRIHEHKMSSWAARFTAAYFMWLVVRFAAAFVLGMVLYALLPRLYSVHLDTAGDLGRALGKGFLALVAMPVAACLVALTIVGIPLALVGMAAYLGAVYVSGIVVAALVGTHIMKPETETSGSFALALLVGLAILFFATAIPFIGGPMRFVVLLSGLGLLVDRAHAGWKSAHRA